MNDSKRITTLIVKLIRETKEESMQWKVNDIPVQLSGGAEVVGKVYTSVYRDRHFRMFKYRDRYYTDVDTYGWDEKIRLEVTDSQFNPEWPFPEEHALHDLYGVVSFQVAGISHLLDDILDKDDLVESDSMF